MCVRACRTGPTGDGYGRTASAADTASPAEACNVARALELEVPAFDVNSACTSFFVQMNLLTRMRPDQLPDYVLLVAPDCLTKTVDYSDRSAAVLWGDAAAAAVVSTRHPGRARVLGSTLESSPAGNTKVVVPRGRPSQERVKIPSEADDLTHQLGSFASKCTNQPE